MSSQIKGGGIASLSEETYNELVDLLMGVDDDADDADDKTKKKESDHHKAKARKKYIQRLQESYQKSKFASLQETFMSEGNHAHSGSSAGPASSAPVVVEKKIRLEIIEIVYPMDNQKSSKSSSKSKSKNKFKEKSKKLLVVPNTTIIEAFLKQAKSKLNLKKPVTRCFIIKESVELDLMTTDSSLRGLSDGEKIFICCQEDKLNKAKQPQQADDVVELSGEDDQDPLEAVKQAYSQKDKKYTRQNKRAMISENFDFRPVLDNLLELPQARASLPAGDKRREFLELASTHRVVIVTGETGSGKSTQIPQFLFEGMRALDRSECTNILCTQPRRVAAVSLAHRVASEMASPPPGSPKSLVGYNIRLDRAISDDTKITYCTVGILLRMLVNDPASSSDTENDRNIPLSDISCIVLDEIHERDLTTDFCITLIRGQLLKRNPYIKIVLMSATTSADLFCDYFGSSGYAPARLHIEGRTFPVETIFLQETEKYTGRMLQGWSINEKKEDENNSDSLELSPRAKEKIDNQFLRELVCKIIRNQQSDGELDLSSSESYTNRVSGAILVFLPGKAEIESLAKIFFDDPLVGNPDLCQIHKLHSTIPKAAQNKVFESAKKGMVKIILSTNIAETSITIGDVSYIIDTGRVKESRFNSSTRINELVTVWTSQASAKQRAGRAGRTSAGQCFRLYPQAFFEECFPQQTTPEILRSPLDDIVLQLCLLYEHRSGSTTVSNGVCPVKFLSNTPEAPPEQKVFEASQHLLEVGALEITAVAPKKLYRLTPLGYHLSRLPMDAKIGKVLIVGSLLGCLDNALTIAAGLSHTKSIFYSTVDKEKRASIVNSRKQLIENGFGGPTWIGGTVKSDLMVVIAAYREWSKKKGGQKSSFCKSHGLDATALSDIESLRHQYRQHLQASGFESQNSNQHNEDALLTSCCLVAGLYPNVSTLIRPRKGGPRGGARLLTKTGEMCRASSDSFQVDRLRAASEAGKDAYAVFHSKHQSIGTNDRPSQVYLSEVNFVPRYALLLFSGDLVIQGNCIILDGWLKFKIGSADKDRAGGALLIHALRQELDQMVLAYVAGSEASRQQASKRQTLLKIIRRLLERE